MNISLVLAILFNHWVADFICQTDEMAQNKSKSNKWLTIHVLAYSAVIFFFFVFITEPWLALVYALGNGILHWCTDYVTSRFNAKMWAEKKVHWFFVGVGFDQFIHYTCLLLSAKLLLITL